MAKHTAAPWVVGEYSENLGYDCMTGGIHAGPVVLDGADYGQKRCHEIEATALERMKADAYLIAAAPDLLAACKMVEAMAVHGEPLSVGDIAEVRAAIAKAEPTK